MSLTGGATCQSTCAHTQVPTTDPPLLQRPGLLIRFAMQQIFESYCSVPEVFYAGKDRLVTTGLSGSTTAGCFKPITFLIKSLPAAVHMTHLQTRQADNSLTICGSHTVFLVSCWKWIKMVSYVLFQILQCSSDSHQFGYHQHTQLGAGSWSSKDWTTVRHTEGRTSLQNQLVSNT